VVRSVANQMKEKTGVMPTLEAAASELGSRGNQGAVRSVANQMKEKTGEMPTLAAVASELGSRGNEGAVRSVANQMKEKTGEMPTLAVAASELGSRGKQGAVRSVANQTKEKTGEMPTPAEAAYELGSRAGRRGQESRRICTISYATENCKNTVQQIDVLCNPCHKRVPKKLKAAFCISVGVGDRVCGREIFRVNQFIKCYYKPEAKKMREEEKAARPKCTIKGMKHHRSRLFPASSNIKIWGELLFFSFLAHPSLFLRAGVPCTIP
jgi:hypothetical protein